MRKVYALSWITLVISLTALCLCSFRCEPIKADWMAILVGILALLVTLLIGWQITRTLDIERRMRRFDNIVDARVSAISGDLVNLILANQQRINIYTFVAEPKSTEECIEVLMGSLEKALSVQTPGVNIALIDLIIDDLLGVISKAGHKPSIVISKENKVKYISIAKKIRHKKIDEVILFVSKAEDYKEEKG